MKFLRKKLFSYLLSLLMVLSLFCTFGSTSFALDFPKGSGTDSDPYVITNSSELNSVRNNLSASYKLANNIVFSETDFLKTGNFYNNGIGFLPIGTEAEPFTGTFDGNGYKIIGAKTYFNGTPSNAFKVIVPQGFVAGESGWTGDYILNELGSEGTYGDLIPTYIGIFAVNKGLIKDLGVENFRLTVVSTAASCYIGTVCGGNKGTISGCYSYGSTVSGTLNKGTLVSAGGLCGNNFDGALIKNCYNNGAVSCNLYAGGVSGYSSGKIQLSYFYGTVTGASNQCDAISNGRGVSDCFYFAEASSKSGQALTADQFGEKISFNNFDFADVWQMNTADKYPELVVTPQKLKKRIAAPIAAPSLLTLNYNKISFAENSELEYSYDLENWQTTEFSGLSYIETYNFYARIKETELYYASPARPAYTVYLGFQFDCDASGVLDDKDINLFQKILAGWDVEANPPIYDINCDENFDDKDISRVAKIVAGWNV